MDDEGPRTLRDFLATRQPVYGWERAAIWLLLATCVGLRSAVDLVQQGKVLSAFIWP